MADVVMNDNDSKIKEVKLNPPKPFDGKKENLRKFVQDGELYLMINKKIYEDDLKKIGFFLSFMNEGDAASWKEQLLKDALARGPTLRQTLVDSGEVWWDSGGVRWSPTGLRGGG